MRDCIAAALSVLPEMANNILGQMHDIWIMGNGVAIPGAKFTSDSNLKFAGGWNLLMELIQQHEEIQAVWMLNDDVKGVSQGVMDRMWSMMTLMPKAAAITPTFNSPHPIFHPCRDGTIRQVPWIDWTCPLVSLQAWRQVGPFDEDFSGYGADIDWCVRARKLNYEFYVDNSHHVQHMGSVSMNKLGETDMRDVSKMGRLLEKKHHVTNWWELTRY